MNISQLREKARSLPKQPGVYIMRDVSGTIIYIGKAVRLRERVGSYFKENADHQPKVARMVSLVNDFDVIQTDTEFEALVLECSLIKLHKPKYNILLKDDKGFSYIRITNEPYPRISAALQKYDDGSRYIGPYMSSFAVKRMVETANTAFRLPTCKKHFPEAFGKTRPCLNAHIGRCMALCSGKVSQQEYAEAVESACALLTRGTDEILRLLHERMLAASDAMEYEKAARLRDSINAIEGINSKQKIVSPTHGDADIFAFAANESCVGAAVLKYRNGVLSDKEEHFFYDTTDIAAARDEFMSHYYLDCMPPREVVCDADFESRDLLERMLTEKRGARVSLLVPQKSDLAKAVNMAYENISDSLKRRYSRATREEASLAELAGYLGLPQPPAIVEAYDISNYGDDAVAGMVVFRSGRPQKGDYRRFRIKTVVGTDDYASMQEVLSRRVARFDDPHTGGSFARKPDLILLDGGRGHLSAACEVLKAGSFADVPVFGMVKDGKHRTRGLVGEFGELDVPRNTTAFHFVARVQDEVHNYSLDYRRKSHSKSSVRSSLLNINGVGETTAKLLMRRFKTVSAIKQSSREDLIGAGLPKRTADNVYGYFHAPRCESGSEAAALPNNAAEPQDDSGTQGIAQTEKKL